MISLNSLKGKLLLPIIVGSLSIILALTIVLLKTQKDVLLESGIQKVDLLTKQSSEVRKIYASKIMPKIVENGGYDNADWENLKGAVPAAATLVNMVGHNLAQAVPGVKLRLYSEHPFKNRTVQLDDFEKRSLKNLQKDPSKPYYEIIEKNGETYIKYALADVMSNGCVKCHNSHPLTSKNDWQVGDFRGAVAATVPLTSLKSELTNSFTILYVIIFILLILLVIYTSFGINKVSKNIKSFQDTLINFFAYMNKEQTKLDINKIDSNDEIGEMSKLVNKNIEKEIENNRDDVKVLGETVLVMDKMSKGMFGCKINATSNNPTLRTLIKTINKTISFLSKDINQMKDILEGFTKDDYTNRMNITPAITAEMLAVMQSINTLGETLSNNAKQNLSNGQQLESNSNVMTESVTNLANKANQQAASLEETAAAVEEITSITRNNATNTAKMSELGNKVKQEVSSGMELATKTSTSMDEINSQVTSINEAITIIDQIAFQTNILSLNAAVEAATAGEAGKGFAVVAQEVRNLAARSAEAANEIKSLVENATQKAYEGKNVSDQMIKGYESLNKSFSETITLIEDVSNASKEQMLGIEQINDTVTQLDRVTQENAHEANAVAQTAEEVSAMAEELVNDASSKKFGDK